MPVRDIVVIGASAGGVETLTRLVRSLPANLPAALFVVIHFPAESVSLLPQILNRNGPVPAAHPLNNDIFYPGHIYVAPPNQHMQIEDGRVRLDYNARVNGVRPSIDILFRSAARSYGARVIGVILSGTLGDGIAGLQAIKTAGGITIVQDPEDAPFGGLPSSALERVQVDYVLSLQAIAAKILELIRNNTPVSPEHSAPPPDWKNQQGEQTMNDEMENDKIQKDIASYEKGEMQDTHTVLTCPDCGGVLWELQDGELLHYRCHVGHIYSPESLLGAHVAEVESALWSAVRSLEERASLLRRLTGTSMMRGHSLSARRFQNAAKDAEANARVIRDVLLNRKNEADQQLFTDRSLDADQDAPLAQGDTDPPG